MALHFLRLPSLAPEVRQVLKRMVPGIIGAGVTQLNLAVDVIIASFLPAGAVSYLYYADRLMKEGCPARAATEHERGLALAILLLLPMRRRNLDSGAQTMSIEDRACFIDDVRRALYGAKIAAYAQGFDEIATVSEAICVGE